jgi:hypothetical protein
LEHLRSGALSLFDGYHRLAGNDLVDFAESNHRGFILWDIAAGGNPILLYHEFTDLVWYHTPAVTRQPGKIRGDQEAGSGVERATD